MFIKWQSEQPGQYIQVAIGSRVLKGERPERYTLLLNRDFAVSRPDMVIWQVMTTNPAAVAGLLLQRLRYTNHTQLPFVTMHTRVLRAIADVVMMGGDTVEPPAVGMASPCAIVYHTTRVDVVSSVQSIDGRAFMFRRKQMVRAFPPVPTRAEGGDLVYTVDECDALMLDSLRWRARLWVRNHPPTARSSRFVYYYTYASCNGRHLGRQLFDLVVGERYEKLRCVDDGGMSIWVRR